MVDFVFADNTYDIMNIPDDLRVDLMDDSMDGACWTAGAATAVAAFMTCSSL